MKKIWIGNDHGGYEMKLQLLEHLEKNGFLVVNVGSDSTENVPYPYYAMEVATAISRDEADRGILICSTGIGMSIIANKFKGVRASLCKSTYMAKMTRAHNNSNILCLGAKTTGITEVFDILDTWLSIGYEGGKYDISLGLIDEVEKAICNPNGRFKFQ